MSIQFPYFCISSSFFTANIEEINWKISAIENFAIYIGKTVYEIL